MNSEELKSYTIEELISAATLMDIIEIERLTEFTDVLKRDYESLDEMMEDTGISDLEFAIQIMAIKELLRRTL